MTRAETANRILFELRVLGVATAETLFVETEIPGDAPLPVVGEFVSPPTLGSDSSRLVVKVARTAPGSRFAAIVTLEPVDISFGERPMDEEIRALRRTGWRN
jgi:hypothetical protein